MLKKNTEYQKECVRCKEVFITAYNQSKYCGQICKEIVKIKKSNDLMDER